MTQRACATAPSDSCLHLPQQHSYWRLPSATCASHGKVQTLACTIALQASRQAGDWSEHLLLNIYRPRSWLGSMPKLRLLLDAARRLGRLSYHQSQSRICVRVCRHKWIIVAIILSGLNCVRTQRSVLFSHHTGRERASLFMEWDEIK